MSSSSPKRRPLSGFQRVLGAFMPREEDFFVLFQQLSDIALSAVETLRLVANDYSKLDYAITKVDELEHEGDELVHEIVPRLNTTFVTPTLLDREGIYRLAERLDDITDPTAITHGVVLAGLLGAITWNLITWYYGLPSSSSHALIGGVVGAAALSQFSWAQRNGYLSWSLHYGVFQAAGLQKILLALVLSPLIGYVGGLILMIGLMYVFRRAGQHHPRHLLLDHGRGRLAPPQLGAVEDRGEHRHGLDLHHPGGRGPGDVLLLGHGHVGLPLTPTSRAGHATGLRETYPVAFCL